MRALILLLGSIVLMTAALVASLSRSGLVGLLVGLLMLGLAGRRRFGTAGTGAFATATVALLLLALQYANTSALACSPGRFPTGRRRRSPDHLA